MSKVNEGTDLPVAPDVPWKLLGPTDTPHDQALHDRALHVRHTAVENSALESDAAGGLRKLHPAGFARFRKPFVI